jgi:hypothetical protein
MAESYIQISPDSTGKLMRTNERTIGANLVHEEFVITATQWDYCDMTYTSNNLTGVVFKAGGALGTTVETWVLTYDGSNNLLTILKT